MNGFMTFFLTRHQHHLSTSMVQTQLILIGTIRNQIFLNGISKNKFRKTLISYAENELNGQHGAQNDMPKKHYIICDAISCIHGCGECMGAVIKNTTGGKQKLLSQRTEMPAVKQKQCENPPNIPNC